MSRRLRALKQTGLVEDTHPNFDARVRIFTLSPAPLADLMAWLEETDRLWASQLAAFKRHVESGEAG